MKKIVLILGLALLGSCSSDTLNKDKMSIEVAQQYKENKFEDTLLVIRELSGETNTEVNLFDKKGKEYKGKFNTENNHFGIGLFFGFIFGFLCGFGLAATIFD